MSRHDAFPADTACPAVPVAAVARAGEARVGVRRTRVSDAAAYAIEGSNALTAIDYSDVCLNYDLAYFEDKGVAVPQSFDDLLKPEYKGLLSVTNPATSSPGLAFLLGTIAAKGDGWAQYWTDLAANDLRVNGGATVHKGVNLAVLAASSDSVSGGFMDG